jgi:hypothetical protein
MPGKLAMASATGIRAIEPFWMAVFTCMTAKYRVIVQHILLPVSQVETLKYT